MGPEEFLGDSRIGLTGFVDHHGHQECRVIRHVVQPPRREMPFTAEVTLGPRVGVGRDQRYKQRAIVDLFLDLQVPRVSPAQLASVEPHFNARFTQGFADARGSICILRGVGQENGTGRVQLLTHELALTPPMRRILAGTGRCKGNGMVARGGIEPPIGNSAIENRPLLLLLGRVHRRVSMLEQFSRGAPILGIESTESQPTQLKEEPPAAPFFAPATGYIQLR